MVCKNVMWVYVHTKSSTIHILDITKQDYNIYRTIDLEGQSPKEISESTKENKECSMEALRPLLKQRETHRQVG